MKRGNNSYVELGLIRLVRIEEQPESIARDMTEVNERLPDRNSSTALALKNLHEFLVRQQPHFDRQVSEGKISTSLFGVDARDIT